MVAQPANTALQLIGMAQSLFGFLTPAEEKLLFATTTGGIAICGPPTNEHDPAYNPSNGNTWGPERQIRAALIRWLCADRRAQELVDPKGIHIVGASITDPLDLSNLTIQFGLTLSHCRTADISFRAAALPEINLLGTWIASLDGDDLRVRGHFLLRDGSHTEGIARLLEAHIGGNLDCSRATLSNPFQPNNPNSGKALMADGSTVGGSVFLTDDFHAEGQVRFTDSKISLNMECTRGIFSNPPSSGSKDVGAALLAERVRIGGSLLLNDKFNAEGEVNLVGATIEGILDSKASTFRNPYQRNALGSGTALNADHATFRNGVQFLEGVKIYGLARLINARIGGSFQCSGVLFSNPPTPSNANIGPALDLSQISIESTLTFDSSTRAEGEVRLLGAQVGGDLECSQCMFVNPPQKGLAATGTALRADGAGVKGSLSLHNGFRSEGQVRLIATNIARDLDCSYSTFVNPPPGGSVPLVSLLADRIITGGSIFFQDCHIEGAVQLMGAQIGEDLYCRSAEFEGPFVAEGTTIRGNLAWLDMKHPESSSLDLINVSSANYGDDEQSWPPPRHLALDGFTYKNISGGPTDATTRLRWLKLQKDFKPQPYTQLAKVLSETGDETGAKRVLAEMERLQREGGTIHEAWSGVLRYTTGYGYYPQRSLWFLAGFTGLWWFIFWRANRMKLMIPTDESAHNYFRTKNHPPPHYPRFCSFVYSLENLLPLVKLGQADKWQPDPTSWLRIIVWIGILLGWFFAILFAAAVTGIIHIK